MSRFLDLPGYQLGGNATLAPGGEARVLAVYGREACAESVIVSLNVKRISPAPIGNDARLRAVLRWGSHCGDNQVELDARHGTRLVLEASRVTCDLHYEGATGPQFTVTASIGYGSASGTKPTWTAPLELLGAGAVGSMIQVPAWADGVAVLQGGDPTAMPAFETTIAQFGEAAAGTLLARMSGGTSFVPLAPNAEFVRITNTSAAAQEVTAIFSLAL